jgi:hypothetical protein
MTPSSPTPVNTAAASVLSIPRPVGAIPGALTGKAVDITVSFVEYPADSRWFYAPLVHIDAGSEASATLTGFSFSIPGLGSTGKFCAALPLPPGFQFELFREIYGDYEFTIDNPGHRATEAAGTATINLTDDAGVATTRTLTGPIVPGSLPTTYSGGNGGGYQPCR